MKNITPQDIVLAHQYLYYVLSQPIWEDYYYDKFCKKHDIEGGGGSDLASSYPQDIIYLAEKMTNAPFSYSYERLEKFGFKNS